MPGGHFDFVQFKFHEASEEIERIISINKSNETDKYGDKISYDIPEDTIQFLKSASKHIRAAGDILHEIDWYLSHDIDEKTMMNRLKEKGIEWKQQL